MDNQVKKIFGMPLRRYSILGICVFLAIVFTLLLTSEYDEGYTAPPPAVEIIQPERRTISQSITLSGHVEALDTIPVIPLVSGTITEYPVKAGMVVVEGELLAVIDRAPFEQQVYQARAAYESYESTFQRIEELYKAKAATQQDFETITAQRDGARAQLELAELQLGYAKVRAPISGTVLSAPLARGNVGSQQQPIAIIADLSELVVRLNVPEKYFDLFNENSAELFAYVRRGGTVDSPDQVSANADIDSIAPYIQAESKTFQVVFALTENIEFFRPGMFVEVTIVYDEQKDVLTLPLSVLKVDGSCYTFEPNKIGEADLVESGIVSWQKLPIMVKDNEFFMVSENFLNEWFVIAGQNIIFDEQRVTPLESQNAGAL